MNLAGSKPSRAPGEEWKDTFGILANLPNNVAEAVIRALASLKK